MSILSLKNISKYYKVKSSEKVYVLKDINLSFEKNELVAIIGESGSGKSTLMNLIGGLDSKYNGELFVNGENIKKFKKRELDDYRKNKIGFVFQSFNLIPHLSILNNVAIAMTLSNVKKKERVKRAKELLIELGLKDHINKKPNQLSGGQKQRVAIARALVNDPEIIIADEPTGSLDSKTSMQVLEIMKSMSLSSNFVWISDFITELTVGKLILKSGSGLLIVPFKPMVTSTGTFLVIEEFSIKTAGFADVS